MKIILRISDSRASDWLNYIGQTKLPYREFTALPDDGEIVVTQSPKLDREIRSRRSSNMTIEAAIIKAMQSNPKKSAWSASDFRRAVADRDPKSVTTRACGMANKGMLRRVSRGYFMLGEVDAVKPQPRTRSNRPGAAVVFKACKELDARGIEINCRTVDHHLGMSGSSSSISYLLHHRELIKLVSTTGEGKDRVNFYELTSKGKNLKEYVSDGDEQIVRAFTEPMKEAM